MQVEMQAIEFNITWEVSDLSKTHKAIGLNWVYKMKKNPKGKIVKYKTRLVSRVMLSNKVLTLMRSLHRWSDLKQ